jgi:hypothetical protein
MGIPVNPIRKEEFIGKISVIQEKGFKARVVAVPNSGAQVAFRPLHSAINKLLKGLKTDCTFDQVKGALWAQSKLKNGERLWSVDLSSATDRFPLGAQIAVLESLGYKYVREFQHAASISRWISPLHEGTAVRYSAGQPMGLYGSFALFALTHNFLLTSLGGTEDQFRVLGDDVIIADAELARKYTEWLKDEDVPVSWHKTLLNAPIAEFAGFIITPTGLYKGSKYPNGLVEPWSFVEQTRRLGLPLWSTVPKGHRKFAKLLLSLPEDLGGLGMNPEGRPLLERVTEWTTSLEHTSSPDLKNPNLVLNEMVKPFSSMVPGTQVILEFLFEQNKKVIEDAKQKLPLLSVLPDAVVASHYLAAVQKGIAAWETPSSNLSAVQGWNRLTVSKTLKPSWH